VAGSPCRLGAVALATVLALGFGAGLAQPAQRASITLQMIGIASQQPGYSVLIPNFERVYPDNPGLQHVYRYLRAREGRISRTDGR